MPNRFLLYQARYGFACILESMGVAAQRLVYEGVGGSGWKDLDDDVKEALQIKGQPWGLYIWEGDVPYRPDFENPSDWGSWFLRPLVLHGILHRVVDGDLEWWNKEYQLYLEQCSGK